MPRCFCDTKMQAAVGWQNTVPVQQVPDSKVHGANMGPTWVLSVPDGPYVGPMNLTIRGASGS